MGGGKVLQKLEYWDGNNYYGIGTILKRYAGLPAFVPLNFTIQHGITFFSIYPSLDDCKEIVDFYVSKDRSTQFLIFNNNYLPHFHAKSIFHVRAIGAPVIYLDDFIARIKTKSPPPRGTIVFPHNSTHHVDVSTNFDLYARMLTELPTKFHPIKVCMYYLDIEKGYDRSFREKGFEILCNGTLWSGDFLHNFIRNALHFEYACSNNNLSSTGYYSIYLGLKYFRYGPAVSYRVPGQYGEKYEKEYRILQAEDTVKAFPIETCEDYASQKDICRHELGVRLKLTKREMREMILAGLKPEFLRKYTSAVLPRFRCGRMCEKILSKTGRLLRLISPARMG